MRISFLKVPLLWKSITLALAFCWLAAAAIAANQAAVTVQSIKVGGTPATEAPGVLVTAPGETRASKRTLRMNATFDPGTVIEVPARTVVELSTANGNTLTLHAGSRIKIEAVSSLGERFRQVLGKVKYLISRKLSFFNVTKESFVAAVKGTEFMVAVDQREIQLDWIAGQIEFSRKVKIKIEEAEKAAKPNKAHRAKQPGVATLTVSEVVSAGNPRVSYRLDVDEYLKKFKTYKDAEKYFRTRLKEAEASGDQQRIREGLTNLGLALATVGKAEDAVVYLEKALAIDLKLYPDGEHPDIAAGYNDLGTAYADLGEPRKALEYHEKALALDLKLFPDGVASDYNNLGTVYADLGKPGKAIEHYEKALAIDLRLYPDGVHPDLSADYDNLGSSYADLGELRKAIEYHEKALAIDLKLHPAGAHPDISSAYYNLGTVYADLGKPGKAIEHYEKALAIDLKLYPDGVHPNIADAYRGLAEASEDAGDPDRADDYENKAEAIDAKLDR